MHMTVDAAEKTPQAAPKVKFDQDEFFKTANERLVRDGLPPIKYSRVLPISFRDTLCEVSGEINKAGVAVKGYGVARADNHDIEHIDREYGALIAAKKAVENYRRNAKDRIVNVPMEHAKPSKN